MQTMLKGKKGTEDRSQLRWQQLERAWRSKVTHAPGDNAKCDCGHKEQNALSHGSDSGETSEVWGNKQSMSLNERHLQRRQSECLSCVCGW